MIRIADIFKRTVFKIYSIFKSLLALIYNFIFFDLKKILSAFQRHDGELYTCAIAFFLLISFIPISLVIISIMSFFYQSGDVAILYFDKVREQLPAVNIDDFMRIIDKIVFSKRYLAFVWIPFLFWWGSLVFDIIERVLEKAFRIEKSRKYWKAKLRHFMIIVTMGVLVVALILFSNIIAIFQNSELINLISRNIQNIDSSSRFIFLIADIPFIAASFTTLIINTLILFVLYRLLPPVKLDRLSIFKGALFASSMYEAIKMIFSFYISEINDYTSIFGSLSSIVIIMIWIWYTCFLFVIGAEAAWVFYEKKGGAKAKADETD